MSMQDPVADMYTRIRNAQRVNKRTVSFPASKLKQSLLKAFLKEGFIEDFMLDEDEPSKPNIIVKLKYHQGRPCIQTLRQVSKASIRVYASVSDLEKMQHKLGWPVVLIVSTSQGVMTAKKACQLNLGGEVLCWLF